MARVIIVSSFDGSIANLDDTLTKNPSLNNPHETIATPQMVAATPPSHSCIYTKERGFTSYHLLLLPLAWVSFCLNIFNGPIYPL